MKFVCEVELKVGYVPSMEVEEETEINFTIEAESRVNAHRMLKAMFLGASNISDYAIVSFSRD